MSSVKKPVFGYWDIRGLAAPIRNLLHYAEVDFEDKKYACGPAPGYDKTCWFDVKFTLGLPFPNLPYYKDDDGNLCQSNAILRHIARKYKVLGNDEKANMRIDMVESEICDFRSKWVGVCYGMNKNEEDHFSKVLPKFLEDMSEFLGDNNWLGGDKISHVDFILYEMLDQALMFRKECTKDHANLQKFLTRFRELPTLKAYLSSDEYKKLPLNNRMAKLGSTAQ